MIRLRPNGQRAELAIGFICVVLVLEVVLFVSAYIQYDLLSKVSKGLEVPFEAIEASDSRQMWFGVLYLLAYIVSIVTFIQWFRRAYFNLHQKSRNLSHSEGWAAGCWFIPIVCLYRPYQIMKEIYEVTNRLTSKSESGQNARLSLNVLVFWWTLWIINTILGQASFRLSMKAESVNALITSSVVDMAGNLFGIPLALITIKMIRDYSRVEPLLADQSDDWGNEESIAQEITLG